MFSLLVLRSVLARFLSCLYVAQNIGHLQVVEQHGAHGNGFDQDHGSGCRSPSYEHEERERVLALE